MVVNIWLIYTWEPIDSRRSDLLFKTFCHIPRRKLRLKRWLNALLPVQDVQREESRKKFTNMSELNRSQIID